MKAELWSFHLALDMTWAQVRSQHFSKNNFKVPFSGPCWQEQRWGPAGHSCLLGKGEDA